MNIEQYLEYGSTEIVLLTEYSSTDCCKSCITLGPGDSALNKTYLAFKECRI